MRLGGWSAGLGWDRFRLVSQVWAGGDLEQEQAKSAPRLEGRATASERNNTHAHDEPVRHVPVAGRVECRARVVSPARGTVASSETGRFHQSSGRDSIPREERSTTCIILVYEYVCARFQSISPLSVVLTSPLKDLARPVLAAVFSAGRRPSSRLSPSVFVVCPCSRVRPSTLGRRHRCTRALGRNSFAHRQQQQRRSS